MKRVDQRGAATVLVIAMTGVLLLVGAATGVVAAIVVAHRTARAAADLAALAAAATLADPARPGDPCAVAGEVATANAGSLTSCVVEDHDVLVEVTVPGPRWLGQDRDLVGTARAGPDTQLTTG